MEQMIYGYTVAILIVVAIVGGIVMICKLLEMSDETRKRHQEERMEYHFGKKDIVEF